MEYLNDSIKDWAEQKKRERYDRLSKHSLDGYKPIAISMPMHEKESLEVDTARRWKMQPHEVSFEELPQHLREYIVERDRTTFTEGGGI